MEEYSREGDAAENNIAVAHLTLDTKGYEHTLRLCIIIIIIIINCNWVVTRWRW